MGITSLACPAKQSDLAGPELQAPAPPNVPDLPTGSPLSPSNNVTTAAPEPHQLSPNNHSPRAFTFDFMDDEDAAAAAAEAARATGAETEESVMIHNITCFVMMMDLVLVQVNR